MSHRVRVNRGNKPKSKEESDEIALLRYTHSVNLRYLNELFPDWSDEDLLYTLQDTFGDLELTVARISEGFASQWGEVKNRKPKKETLGAAQPSASKTPFPRSQDDRKVRGVPASGSKPPRTPRTDRPSNKSSYRTNEHGTIAPAPENAGQGSHNSTEASGWNSVAQPSNQESGWESLPQTNDGWGDSTQTKDTSADWGASPADTKYGKKPAPQAKAPVPQNTWASRVAKSTPATPVARDRKPRINHSKTQETSHPERQIADTSRASDNFPNLGGKDSSAEAPIQNGAPSNTWAKIASRASQPKPAAPKPVEPEPEHSNWDVPDFVEPAQSDALEVSLIAPEHQDEELAPETQSEGVETSEKAVAETSSDQKPAEEVTQSHKSSNEGRHSSAVVIPGTMAAKMGEISKKFAKMETSDLDLSVSEQSLEGLPQQHQSPQQAGAKLPPPGISIAPSGIRTSRPLAASKPSFVPSSYANGSADTDAAPADAQASVPEPASENLSAEAPAQPHASPAPEQRNGVSSSSQQATKHSQAAAKAPQHNAAHGHEASQHAHQSYYAQSLAHTHGAPIHQPPMHPQMMHQHQGQSNYMPYYPQYPYAPGHYNPYQGNNYTMQFAQKSLSGYDDANGNFQITPGTTPTLPQDAGSSTGNHSYEKSGHGKHKNYEAANDAGSHHQAAAPVGYGFGYNGVPSYQAPGGPADGPIYYPHPYYTQPGHQHMFPYPGAPGLQHLPPHLQQQHAGYSNPHPLQQQHQGHQQSQQQQYPSSQQSPHHYPGHHQQQSNPNMRYQGWNN